MQGYVTKIGTKQGAGAHGPWTLYSVQIDGAKWLGAKFKAPACNEGDLITYDIVADGQYENIANIAVVAGGAAQAPTAVASAPSVSPPVNKTQLSIHLQSCRNAAIATLTTFLENDVVKLPAKQADKYEAALSLIEEMTGRYFFKLEKDVANGGMEVADVIPPPAAAVA